MIFPIRKNQQYLSNWENRSGLSLTFLVVLLSTFIPRLLVLGGFPNSDEGLYTYTSQLFYDSIVSGHGLPSSGSLALYPLMTSWVFAFHVNHIISLRLVDMVVACAASWFLVRLLQKECGSAVGGALIALVFLFVMNQPLFLQNGFRNSIFAAYVPLFAAIYIAIERTKLSDLNCICIGALVSLAVLLREPLLPFFAVAMIAVGFAFGRRALFHFLVGSGACVLFVFSVNFVMRGGISSMIETYRSATTIYSVLFGPAKTFDLFVNGSIQWANESLVPLFLVITGIFILLFELRKSSLKREHLRYVFWLFVAAVPLLEPFLKAGYAYHFACCLPGLAGLTACTWRRIINSNLPPVKVTAFITLSIACISLTPKFVPLIHAWPITFAALQNFDSYGWPADQTEKSNYLIAANEIDKLPPGTLAVSGNMWSLYTITDRLPPDNEISNLSYTFYVLGFDEALLKQKIIQYRPTVIMTTDRPDFPESEKLDKVIRETGVYRAITTVSHDDRRSYGRLGGTIYLDVAR